MPQANGSGVGGYGALPSQAPNNPEARGHAWLQLGNAHGAQQQVAGVPLEHFPVQRGGTPAPRLPAAEAHAALAQSRAQPQAHAPSQMGNFGRHALTAAGAGLGLYGLYNLLRGSGRAGDEQQARMQAYLANSAHMQPQMMPSMSVYASYDKFAATKLAELKEAAGPPFVLRNNDTYGKTQGALSDAFAKSLADKFVSEPIDAIHRTLKKMLYDDPEAHDTFHGVVQDDDLLRDTYAAHPEHLEQSFNAMKKFGPSLVTSPAAVRSFLRQSAMTGGNIDFATIKLIAETEKMIQNAKGRGLQT